MPIFLTKYRIQRIDFYKNFKITHANINLTVTKFYVDILQIFTSYATGTCPKLLASLFRVILQMFKRSQSIEYSPTFDC